MSSLAADAFNQDKRNSEPVDHQQLNKKFVSDQTDSEELKSQLRDLDPKLVGDEEGRYTGIARIIPKCVVDAFYHISNLWNHSKIKSLQDRISKLEHQNSYDAPWYTKPAGTLEALDLASLKSEEFDFSDVNYSSDSEIDEELAELFAAGGTREELEAREKELLRKMGYDSCDEKQNFSDDFEEDSILQQAASPSLQPSLGKSHQVELLQVSSPLRAEVVTPEVTPQVEENQAMKRLEAFDHPFITEKFTEENVQNVETVGEAIKITLKGGLVITAKKEEGKLLLTGDGLQKFAEGYFKSQFDTENTFKYFWDRYLKDHTLQTLEVQEDQSIRIVSNAPAESNKCRSDLEQATQYNSFDIKGKHPLIDFKEVKTITQQTKFLEQGKQARFELIGRWDLEMNDGTQLIVEREGNKGLKLSGSALPALMEKQLRNALGENHKGFFPLEKIQSVFVSYTYDKQNPNKLRVDFGEKLEGTTDQVKQGGWQDMKHNQIVMEKSLDINIYPGQEVLFEKGKVRMGVHIEDYDFIINLPNSVKGTHTVLNQSGYTEWTTTRATAAMEFSMQIESFSYLPKQDSFSLGIQVDNQENTLSPRARDNQIAAQPIFDTFVFNGYSSNWGLSIPGLKEVRALPLTTQMYQDSFAHFEWQALSE